MANGNYFHEIAEKNPEIGLIKFTNVSTGGTMSFPAFIKQFNDNFTVGFGGDTPFGRNDPVKHYQSTSRQIQVTFDIVSVDKNQAIENFQKYSKLIQMCYPVYSDPIGPSNNARTIKAPPLWRIKYANYISSPTGAGLLGTIGGITFNPNFEQGHFIHGDKLVPLIYNLSLTFQPLHEEPLGFNKFGTFLNRGFPYGFEGSFPATPIKP